MSEHGASQDRSDEAPVEREVDPPPAEIPSSGGDKATAEQDTQKRERGEDSEPDATEEETSPPEPKRRLPAPNQPLFSRSRDARRLLGDGTPADAYRDLNMATWSQAQMRSNATRSRSGSRSGSPKPGCRGTPVSRRTGGNCTFPKTKKNKRLGALHLPP